MVWPTFDPNNHVLNVFPNNKNVIYKIIFKIKYKVNYIFIICLQLYDWNDGPQPLDKNAEPRPMYENIGQSMDISVNNNLTPWSIDTINDRSNFEDMLL